MTSRRFFSLASSVIVFVIAAAASYTHQTELSIRAHQPVWLAHLMPLTIDAVVIAATLALSDGRSRIWPARTILALYGAATIAANIADAHPDALSRLVSAVPPISLLAVTWLLDTAARQPVAVAILEENAQVNPATEVAETVTVTPPAAPRARAPRKASPKAAAVIAVKTANPDLPTPQVALLAGASTRTARRAINGHSHELATSAV